MFWGAVSLKKVPFSPDELLAGRPFDAKSTFWASCDVLASSQGAENPLVFSFSDFAFFAQQSKWTTTHQTG
jgi:hypothetical protein